MMRDSSFPMEQGSKCGTETYTFNETENYINVDFRMKQFFWYNYMSIPQDLLCKTDGKCYANFKKDGKMDKPDNYLILDTDY